MSQYRVKAVDLDYYRRNIPCQDACPAHTDARGYVQAIAQGDYEWGYLMARQPNPLASTCGRVCVAPCVDACRRGKLDTPIPIRALKRFLTQRYGVEGKNSPLRKLEGRQDNSLTWESHYSISQNRQPGKARVAVIGSGPAGLTCAHDLALLGYPVTIFETLAVAGGNPRIAIPSYRLPRQITDQEVKAVLRLGVELRLYSPVDGTLPIPALQAQGFEAVFLATGVEKRFREGDPSGGVFAEWDLGVEGQGIIHAVACGHRGARAIDQYLKGEETSTQPRGWLVPVDPSQFFNIDYLQLPRREPPLSPSPWRDGLEMAYTEEVAVEQARRCLNCNVQTVFDGEKCILCGACVDICPQRCLKLVKIEGLQGDETAMALIRSTYEKDHESLEGAVAMIKDETRCIRCGLCHRRCPTGAVQLMAFYFEESYAPVKVSQPTGVA